MRYKVIRNCYWNRQLWEKDEEVELDGAVPEHFRPLYSPAEKMAMLKTEETIVEETPEQEIPSGLSLEEMNPGQLQKLARENGLKMPKNAKKEELISALRGE